MKYTIQDLADGKVAMTLEPTTTPEQLKEVLTKAFPNDGFCKEDIETYEAYVKMYTNEYYYKSDKYNGWQSNRKTTLPTTSINTFLVKLEHGKWYKCTTDSTWILKYDEGKNPESDVYTGYFTEFGIDRWSGFGTPSCWIPATKEDLAKLGNEWKPYWEETYPEYKVGQKVKIHSGCNSGLGNGKIGIITEVDKEYCLQPCLEVKEDDTHYQIYPNPDSGVEFNVEILEEPCNLVSEVVVKESDCEFQFIAANIADLLAYKNAKYGASALNPINIFNGKTKVGQRVDDKISRIQNNPVLQKNDVVDLIGYLILICKENNWTTFEEFKD